MRGRGGQTGTVHLSDMSRFGRICRNKLLGAWRSARGGGGPGHGDISDLPGLGSDSPAVMEDMCAGCACLRHSHGGAQPHVSISQTSTPTAVSGM